ncbi:hypothetical protein [Anaerococcus prevotii]|uniref:Putative lipoprotein n=1 Tax=Anaerococcus prevotii ACS-065-V-Col13 TaxID=879305 RepID=F0GX21_9FIRM|nr:hypothetical protein [Anaerococcus prevotii]EGC81609.1 putative lipoprotein [Anaerococcus prevotii ACS-065-V-Col13]
MQKFKTDMPALVVSLLFTIISCTICNILGEESLGGSLAGMIILTLITLAGYFLSYVVPAKKISAVLWISIIAIFIASPISPVSDFVVKSVDNISINAIITPILAYAGIIIGKDWGAFKKVGARGIIVSIFVIIGTFLISSLLGDFFMNIF